jgi:hypothetical protein
VLRDILKVRTGVEGWILELSTLMGICTFASNFMAVTLTLNCWMHGNDVSQVFPIKITQSETFSTLKKAIKDEKKPELDHVAAGSLKLWNVNIPIGRDLQEALASVDLQAESMSSVDDLVAVFSVQPPRKRLHIVVQPHVGK